MHRIGELLRERSIGLVGWHLVVAGFFAIRPPMPPIGARLGVEHNDAAIRVAVGDIEFVRLLVESDIGRPASLSALFESPVTFALPIWWRNFPSPVKVR